MAWWEWWKCQMQLRRLETVSVLCPLLFLSFSLFFSLFFLSVSLYLWRLFLEIALLQIKAHTHMHSLSYTHTLLQWCCCFFLIVITNTVNYQLNDRVYRFLLFSASCFRELQHVMTSKRLLSAVYFILRDISQLLFFRITATCVNNTSSEWTSCAAASF